MTRIGLPDGTVTEVEQVGARLQDALVDLIALGLNAKQAHWHVHGTQFLPVHEQLDLLADDTRQWADLVAERSVALGVPVDGRAETVAADSGVGAFPLGFVEDAKAVALLRDQTEAAIARLRAGMRVLGELDPVSEDLVIEVARGLEKHLWMLQAQAA